MPLLDRILAYLRRSRTPMPQHVGSGQTFIHAVPRKSWLLRLLERWHG
jgi:hypothetical protein